MNIQEMELKDVHPYENNPRKNDDAAQYVAESIQQFGFKVPIVVDKNNIIVTGHTRYKAAKKLKLETVPVIKADDLTEEQIKAYRLADNKVAEKAQWDFDLLREELEGIFDLDMEALGFEELAIDLDDKEAEEDDFDEALPAEPESQPGQVYKLGNHRLMVGDSTNQEDVQKLTAGEEIDLCVTDPPYNVDYEGKTKDRLKIQNDKMENSHFFEFLFDAFKNIHDALKPGGAFYIWHADSEGLNFRGACKEAELTVKQCIVWNKNTMVLGRQDYQWKHEPCLYGWKEGAAHYFANDRTQTTVYEDQKADPKKMTKAELIAYVKELTADKINTSVLNEDKPARSDLHPTMKPVKLMARCIKNSSRPGEAVLDLFGGSGSTLVACEQLDRRCYIMEFDPRYADVIIKRWEKLTGKKAELVNG